MNNALSKLKYGWKNICKLWLQERTPCALPACSKPWRTQALHGDRGTSDQLKGERE